VISYRSIRTFVVVLIVMAISAGETHAQRFRGGSFGGHSFAGRSFAARTPSLGYGTRSVRPGYAISGFRSSYRAAPYQPFGYGFNRHGDFRYGYGYGHPYAYGYPWYGYGLYRYGYDYLSDWGYGSPYPGYVDYGALLPGSSVPAGSQGIGAALGSADQLQNFAASIDAVLQASGAPVFMGQIQWPLGLEILPGAASLRERIEGLYTTAAAQAVTGKVNPKLPAQMRRAVKEFQQLVAWDKQERLTLSSTMYEAAEAFLRQLAQSAGRFSALEFSIPSNRDASASLSRTPRR
jgi:hypothetical protein